MHSAAAVGPLPRRACGACGSDEPIVCYQQKFVVPEHYPLPPAYDILTCRRCGFVYADPPATQKDYDRFYSDWSKYDDQNTASGGGVSCYDSARLATTAGDIARALPSKASILDAGCATGGLLTALRDKGFTNLAGLDPSPRCADACLERGFPAYVGTIASAPADIPKFNCIVLSHVLEHVFDIPAFFGAVQRLVVPGGYLYLETPDASCYANHLSAPFQEFNTEHINHFSPRALKNTARRFGLSPVVVEQKLLEISAHTYYPAVFGVFRDLGVVANQYDVIRDPDLPSAIGAYIQSSTVMLEQISGRLAAKLRGKSKVILWGAGQLAMKLLALPCLERMPIRAIVDNNPVLRGKTLRGSPIVAPSGIANTSEPIIITTLLHADEIAAQIRELGLKNPVVPLLPSSSAEVRQR
jgi:2-polyprenyl-3-methyl-5-hydroxy-6-metoxy-1,4-benzoquinol methylase